MCVGLGDMMVRIRAHECMPERERVAGQACYGSCTMMLRYHRLRWKFVAMLQYSWLMKCDTQK